jgi:uncharacterized protein DUF4410
MFEWNKPPITTAAQRPVHLVGALLMAAIVAGCAGASVAPQSQSAPVTGGRPSTVYVYPFAATAQDVTLNQGIFQRTFQNLTDANTDQSQVQIAESTAQTLAANIVQELQSKGYNAVQVARGTPINGDNVLIVDGQFVNINEGNRLRRMVIGLGTGQATLDTKVQIYQLANGNTTQILDFTTHADSGSMPGAALTAPAGAAAGGAVAAASLAANLAGGAAKTYTSSSGYLAKKTADQSVNYMSQYFAQQGWPS